MAMDQKIVDLYEKYTLKKVNRREFIKKLTIIAGSTAAAYALLPLLEKGDAEAGLVKEDDPRLTAEYLHYEGATGKVRAYAARPKSAGKFPCVLVIHENKGLNPHIEDVSRRLALEGFSAMAPDALSPAGGTPGDPDKARSMIKKLDKQANLANFIAAAKYLKTNPLSTGKVGVVGFCWGGALANQMAVNSPDVTAAVPYYGRQPAAEDVPKIKAALLLHYAELDQRINKGIPAFEAALKAASIDYRIYMYAGAKHAFNNDTNAARYHEASAKLAWQRTIDFLKEKLKS